MSAKFVTDKKFKPTTKMLQMWNDTTRKPLGSFRLILHNPKNKKKFSVELLVIDKQLTPLIGARAAQQMGLITVNAQNFKIAEPPERPRTEVKSVQTADELVASYPHVFQRELGALPGAVHLNLKANRAPRPLSHHLATFQRRLKTNWRKNWINYSDWRS